jgi:hypothetical protein
MNKRKVIIICLVFLLLAAFILGFIFSLQSSKTAVEKKNSVAETQRIQGSFPLKKAVTGTTAWESIPQISNLENTFNINYGFALDDLEYVAMNNGDVYAKALVPIDIEQKDFIASPIVYYKYNQLDSSWSEVPEKDLPQGAKEKLANH